MRSALEIRQADGWRPSALLETGGPLARLLLRSTTRIVPRDGFATDANWLTAGQPLMLVEYRPSEASDSQPPGRQVAASLGRGVGLSYMTMQHLGRYGGVWFLATDSGADRDMLRRLRIHLLRIHAERECVKLVLRAIADGSITVIRGSQASDDLQRYLSEAMSRIARRSYHGIIQPEVLKAAYQTDALISESQRASLLENLNTVRGNILNTIKEGTREGGTHFYE